MDNELVSKVKVAYHRNGVLGEGFHVCTFYDKEEKANMVGIVFKGPGQVAVFNQELLGKGIIEFAVNSFRGDVFEPFLRDAIQKWENER